MFQQPNETIQCRQSIALALNKNPEITGKLPDNRIEHIGILQYKRNIYAYIVISVRLTA